MNLKELKTKVDESIEALGDKNPEDVEVQGHFDLDLQPSLTTPTGAVLEFKEQTFELEGLVVNSIDCDGDTFTLMLTEE